jgi:hypothetical protein
MADIHYIHNVTSTVAFDNTIPQWEVALTGIPDVMPDECIIRSISFNGSVADTNAYMIWCSLKNGFIGSFCGGNITSSSPQSRIWLNAPVNNMLQFKLYMPNGINSPPLSAPAMTGDLIIHMDLIKYRRVPQHA